MAIILLGTILLICCLHQHVSAFRLRAVISHRYVHRSTPLYMSKDGKSKKKKKSDTISTVPNLSSPTTASSTRVTNQINIPVRQQIAWAKAYKRLVQSNSVSSSSQPKKFRQQNEKEAPEEYYEVDYVNIKPPAVFIDGYNIIGYINTVENRNIPLEDARDCLISDVGVLKGATGWWIEIVFDAYKTMGGENKESIDNVMITYTSKEETADGYIERRFEELKSQGFTNMIVVTDDMTLRMAAGSSGAGYLSAAMLLEELRIAYQGWDMMAEELERESRFNRPTLADSVSEELRIAIQEAKQQKLVEAEYERERIKQEKLAAKQQKLTTSSSNNNKVINDKYIQTSSNMISISNDTTITHNHDHHSIGSIGSIGSTSSASSSTSSSTSKKSQKQSSSSGSSSSSNSMDGISDEMRIMIELMGIKPKETQSQAKRRQQEKLMANNEKKSHIKDDQYEQLKRPTLGDAFSEAFKKSLELQAQELLEKTTTATIVVEEGDGAGGGGGGSMKKKKS